MAKKALKKLTLVQLKSIYESARRTYLSSYAMMVDDSFAGAKRATEKYGFQPYYDVEWFSLVHRNVKAHNSWASLSEETKQEMLAAINDPRAR